MQEGETMLQQETTQLRNAPLLGEHTEEWSRRTVDGRPNEVSPLVRKKNLRSILSAIGRRWTLGGIESEDCGGDEMTGATVFWAKASARAPRLIFTFPNHLLSTTVLSAQRIETTLDGARSASAGST